MTIQEKKELMEYCDKLRFNNKGITEVQLIEDIMHKINSYASEESRIVSENKDIKEYCPSCGSRSLDFSDENDHSSYAWCQCCTWEG